VKICCAACFDAVCAVHHCFGHDAIGLHTSHLQVGGVEGGVSQADVDAATELLLASQWDGQVDVARDARDALASHLRVEVPVSKGVAAARGTAGRTANPANNEYESYQSLLDDFARGV
jgi:hypothetical protein